MRAHRVLLSVLAVVALAAPATALASVPRSRATATMSVSIDPSRPGGVLPPGFVGLSFEATTLGSPEISLTSSHLPNLLHALGAGLLRFSGDSVDRAQWLPPGTAPAPWALGTVTPTELDHVAALARGAGWSVLLGLNLGHPVAASAADEARTAAAALGSSLAGVEIGNEPDLYARPVPIPFRSLLGSHALRDHTWGFSSYAAQFASMRSAVASAAPAVPLYGPSTAASTWLKPFAALHPPGLAVLTQHYYSFDRCHGGRLLPHGPSIAALLSPRTAQRERRELAGAAADGARRGLPVRLDEANSVACGGQPNTSDTFASALWAVNLGLLAARSGVVGVDFHGGLGSCQTMGTLSSPWYSPLCAQSDGQLRPRPEYYGLLLLSSLEGDAFVPASYRSGGDVNVYALRASDGTLRVVIDDMDTSATAAGGRALPLTVALRAGARYQRASVIRLSAPSVGAKHAITLGGASVAANGSFPGAVATPLSGSGGTFPVTVAPASATIITLSA